MQLFELAGADPARLFSPYCWRVRMALAAKGLEAETIPWRFADKAAIAPHKTVPVLVHDGQRIAESWAIAEYLEQRFPDRPSLFGSPGGRELARFVAAFTDVTLFPAMSRLIVADIVAILDPGDVGYFRTSREARFGKPLEEVQADRDTAVEELRKALRPVRLVLRGQPFLSGETPMHADSVLFGAFQWARCVSPFRLLTADDPIEAWRQRMLDLHDGLARRVPAFD